MLEHSDGYCVRKVGLLIEIVERVQKCHFCGDYFLFHVFYRGLERAIGPLELELQMVMGL